jgi:hypothetical protein
MVGTFRSSRSGRNGRDRVHLDKEVEMGEGPLTTAPVMTGGLCRSPHTARAPTVPKQEDLVGTGGILDVVPGFDHEEPRQGRSLQAAPEVKPDARVNLVGGARLVRAHAATGTSACGCGIGGGRSTPSWTPTRRCVPPRPPSSCSSHRKVRAGRVFHETLGQRPRSGTASRSTWCDPPRPFVPEGCRTGGRPRRAAPERE